MPLNFRHPDADNASALFDLDSLGILKATKVPTTLSWINDIEATLLIDLMIAGEEGITRRRLNKQGEAGTDAARRLGLRDLVKWEHDRFGKPTFLCLTWQGEEAAKTLVRVARHRQPKPATPTG